MKVGDISVGGQHPVVIQSMTNTDTADIDATVKQVFELWKAGSEIVRITVNSEDAAKSVAPIKDKLIQLNCNVPLVGDFISTDINC